MVVCARSSWGAFIGTPERRAEVLADLRDSFETVIGYARESTSDQTTDAQHDALTFATGRVHVDGVRVTDPDAPVNDDADVIERLTWHDTE